MKKKWSLLVILAMLVMLFAMPAQAKVRLNKKKVTITVGKTMKLKVKGTKTKVKWSSSDKKVATVSKKGKVKGKKPGKATITAKVGKKKLRCKVDVCPAKVKTLQLSSSNLEILQGSTKKLNVIVHPANASNKSVKWIVLNTKVAEVDQNGQVTGKKQGSTTVVVSSVENPRISSKCSVIVKRPPVKVSGVKMSESYIELGVGKKIKLSASVIPSNATNKKLVWSSGDTSIATVDQNGNVTGKAIGGTYICAESAEDSSIWELCHVEVEVQYSEKEKMAGIYIKYLEDRLLKDPSSLEVRNVWDAYNDVQQDDGSVSHHEFVVVEYLAKNGYGAKIRYYAELMLDTEPSSIGNSVKYLDGVRYLRWWEMETYPESVTMRNTMNIQRCLDYAETISFS